MLVERPLKVSSNYAVRELADFRTRPTLHVISKDAIQLAELQPHIDLLNQNAKSKLLDFQSLHVQLGEPGHAIITVEPHNKFDRPYPMKITLDNRVASSEHSALAKLFAEAETGHPSGRHVRADLRVEHDQTVATKIAQMPANYSMLTMTAPKVLSFVQAAAIALGQSLQREHTAVLSSEWSGTRAYSEATANAPSVVHEAKPLVSANILAQPMPVQAQPAKSVMLANSSPTHSVASSPQRAILAFLHGMDATPPVLGDHHGNVMPVHLEHVHEMRLHNLTPAIQVKA